MEQKTQTEQELADSLKDHIVKTNKLIEDMSLEGITVEIECEEIRYVTFGRPIHPQLTVKIYKEM